MIEPVQRSGTSMKNRRPWFWLILTGFVAVAAVIIAMVLSQIDGSPAAVSIEAEPLNFAEVVITDLVQEETFDGTLGSIANDPISTQLGGTVTDIPASGETINQGEALFAIDDQPVVLLHGDLPAFRDIAIGEDTVTVASQLNGTITWVAEPGTVIKQGDVLFRVNDQPVVALYGAQPAYRTLALEGFDPAVVAAQAALSSAKANLTALTSPAGNQQVQAARQTLIGTQQTLQDLLNLPDPNTVQIAQANLSDAEAALQLAQAAYDPVSWRPEVGSLPQSLALQQATNSYETALAQYNQASQGATPGQIASAQAQVAQAQASLDTLQQGPDPDAMAAAQAQVDQAQVALDQLLSGASAAGPSPDVQQLKEALIALGYDPDGSMTLDSEFTTATREIVMAWQEDIGAISDGVVHFGEVVFLAGSTQILQTMTSAGNPATGAVMDIASGDAAHGEDVRQLEQALLALGFDAEGELVADGVYNPETNQAVLAFQAAVGLEPDGIIDLGEVVFLPGSVRVTNQLAFKSSGVSAGSPLLGISLSEKVVRFDLPANDQGLLAVGDAVTVEMPDQSPVPATVAFVAQTATAFENGPATFEVRIELDDPTVAAGLDEAPVDVIVVSDAVEEVMAIPVSSLVALLEGGYAVEKETGGGDTQIVAVEVGFFGSNNMIAVISDQLQPGDQVVVP